VQARYKAVENVGVAGQSKIDQPILTLQKNERLSDMLA
jgi:hypothetical protein